MTESEYQEMVALMEEQGIFDDMRSDMVFPWEQATQRSNAFIKKMDNLNEQERCIYLTQLLKTYHRFLSRKE